MEGEGYQLPISQVFHVCLLSSIWRLPCYRDVHSPRTVS